MAAVPPVRLLDNHGELVLQLAAFAKPLNIRP